MKSVVLIGPPGSGKTTLMLGLRRRLADFHVMHYGLLQFEHYLEHPLILPGIWIDGDLTPGSDRLEPEAADWLALLVRHARHLNFQDGTVVLDGHKLLSTELMTELRNHTEHHLIYLAVYGQSRIERQRQRPLGLMEFETRQALEDRYRNLSATYQPSESWLNETMADYERNLARLMELVGITTEVAV
ncbi:MAG TPA: hypothetical protein VKU87_08925 [Thermomicrobiaceae bacterium]|nr:hypothetical protein [Thermomicrobiaceae bacterium]